jgi:hypothetical protein
MQDFTLLFVRNLLQRKWRELCPQPAIEGDQSLQQQN